MTADLHLHSLRSDGALTPRAVISACKALKIPIAAITDHDTVDGVEEAVIAGKEKGVTVIPGIEMSSFREGEIHILGYNIEYKNPGFLRKLRDIQDIRESRNRGIVRKLKEIGIIVDYEGIRKTQRGSVGRIHIALYMRDKGYVNSVGEAFDKYIGFGCPCYMKSPLISPEEAISIIREYGGTAVLAHPYRYVEEGNFREFIRSLPGINGIEIYYPLHTAAIKQELLTIGGEFNYFITGGSDFHNLQSGNPIGSGDYQMDDYAKSILLP